MTRHILHVVTNVGHYDDPSQRGALYEKARLPFASFAVTDGTLVTGQNPGSAKETAEKVAALL